MALTQVVGEERTCYVLVVRAYHEVGVETDGTVDSSIESNDETDGGRIERREVAGHSDGIVERPSNGTVEVHANATVKSRNCPGLRAGEGVIEKVCVVSLVGECEVCRLGTSRERCRIQF